MSTALDHAARPGAGGTDADELRMLRDSAIAFCARESSPARVRGLRGTRPGFDSAVWKKMADQGWLGILSPESFGGSGLGCAAMRVVAEELARALVPEPLAACAVLARGALLYGDNNALRQTLLPKLAAGDLMASLACQEAAGGIVIDNVATTARREGSSVVLNGTKRFVTPAAGVDGYIVSAREDAELALYWVPAAATGIESSLEPRADGTFSATVRLNDVRIDVANRIAHGAVAHDALARALDEAIVIASAELFGVMDRALASMLEYMKTRVQFGKPIGSFQALQHRAVDLYIQKELAVGALDDAVRVLDGGADARPRSLAASRAKSRCADAALLITREAIKLHGAIGFADECDIGLYFQRACDSRAGKTTAANRRSGACFRSGGRRRKLPGCRLECAERRRFSQRSARLFRDELSAGAALPEPSRPLVRDARLGAAHVRKRLDRAGLAARARRHGLVARQTADLHGRAGEVGCRTRARPGHIAARSAVDQVRHRGAEKKISARDHFLRARLVPGLFRT
ncbi:MAG: acyl-CoA dehydrogenase family protein [Betaproteobacteria bacterium]|nr:acyl-CoA dehydrogenase family protein [Betaproteobacteria bacterium]